MSNAFLISLIVSILFEGTYFLSLGLIYQSLEKKNLRIFNTFIFEATPSFKEKNSFLNYFFIFALLVTVFPFVFYAANNIQSYTIIIMVLSVLAGFCLAAIAFVSLDKLREHLYLDLGALTSLFALVSVEAFYSISLYKMYANGYFLAAMIVAIFLALIILLGVFNPKIFDLKNKQNEDGSYSRKKFIFLAFTEWMLYPISILTLVPLFLITMA